MTTLGTIAVLLFVVSEVGVVWSIMDLHRRRKRDPKP